MLILYFVSFKGRYVFSCRGGGGGEGLRPQRGGSSVKVSTKRGWSCCRRFPSETSRENARQQGSFVNIRESYAR